IFPLSFQDSESLDRCIQSALAALYPPFQATSPTVLCQVLSVVERCYRGDGLHYLLHFLLPAKQFLQTLQQDACLQYCGLLFRHEGWPLCIHEKVVVQLCHLDPRLLRPGDFYLLVSPVAAPPPPRARRSSCRGGQEVPDVALQSLFSMAWLDSVNREREQRGASRLERCLLSAHGDVFRVPWEDLVYPQFISRPCATPKEDQESSVKDRDVLIKTSCDHSGDTASSSQDGKPLPSSPKTDQSPANSEGEDSEGEYVELTELPLPRFSPQKGSLTQFISLQHRARTSTHTLPAATAYTPQTTNTHCAASTHTSNTAHAHTDSAQACGDATCMEENHSFSDLASQRKQWLCRSVSLSLFLCQTCFTEVAVSSCRNQRQRWASSADRLHHEPRVVVPVLRQRRAAPPPALLHFHPQVPTCSSLTGRPLRSLCSPRSDITAFVEQEGGASTGADCAGGCPWSCSLPRPVLRPQVAAGESEPIELPGNRSSL
uniref:Uncharacterized protein n=1 Tax=Amphilophus citrinellus TaxID=61819 RepID=A0A3Q0R446_AMPCI